MHIIRIAESSRMQQSFALLSVFTPPNPPLSPGSYRLLDLLLCLLSFGGVARLSLLWQLVTDIRPVLWLVMSHFDHCKENLLRLNLTATLICGLNMVI